MEILENAKKISELVYKEYEGIYFEYKQTKVMPSFKELENLILLEAKYYSILKDFELEWMQEKLVDKELAPIAPYFFDFYFCLDDKEKCLGSRICSRCGLELKKRKKESDTLDYQVAYFPLYKEEEETESEIEQKYQILDSLHFHNFLLLLEENEYFSDFNKVETKILLAYMYPPYERYFLKNNGKSVKELFNIYNIEKKILDSDDDSLFSIFTDCYDYCVGEEKKDFEAIVDITDSVQAADFLYLACYLRAYFKIGEGCTELEKNPYYLSRIAEIEDHYEKVLKR